MTSTERQLAARRNQRAARARVARRTRDLLSWDNGKRADLDAPWDNPDPDED